MKVDDFLQTYCAERRGALWRRIAEQLRRGGKRLRPRLCLQVHEQYGGLHPNILQVAAGWEMLHLGLLMHDDIMDGDYLRHGQPNVMGEYYLRTGDVELARNMALLAGDLCVAAAHDLIQAAGDVQVLKLLHQVMDDVVEGQRLDVSHAADPFETARLKTASYTFVGPMLSGALLAGVKDGELQKLRQRAEQLGVAYQIENDKADAADDAARGRVTTATVRHRKA